MTDEELIAALKVQRDDWTYIFDNLALNQIQLLKFFIDKVHYLKLKGRYVSAEKDI